MASLNWGGALTTGLIEAGKGLQNIGAMRMKEEYLAEEKASATTAAIQSKYEFLYKENNDDAPLLNSGNPITTLEFNPSVIKFRIIDGKYKRGVYGRIELLNELVIENGKNKNTVRLKGRFKWQQTFLKSEINNGTYFLIKSKKFSIRYQRKNASNMAPDKLIDDIYLSKSIGVETNEDSKKHIDSMKLKFNSYPKPESLISFLIQTVTRENDIVLDYHLGSGTTCAVAHKMGRRYIGIEQMDYIHDVTCERLKKVIQGEQGGISKSVNWQGGDSFTYCELAQHNANIIDKIEQAKTTQALTEIWQEIENADFISYKIKPEVINKNIHEFAALSVAEQKQFLIAVLDKNQLYVNYSEIDDVDYQISNEDKALNRQFYGG